jgi:hypothetical protein
MSSGTGNSKGGIMLKFCRHVSLVGAALAVLLLSGAQPAAAAYITIDLRPSGFFGSSAVGVSGGQQVGRA